MPAKKNTILWIDDDKFYAQQFWMLRDEGYELLSATAVDDGLTILAERRRDIVLVIVDVMMPLGGLIDPQDAREGTTTGIVLARKIRDEYPGILIIGCSLSFDDTARVWFERYADGFIDKTFPRGPREVVALIKDKLAGVKTGRLVKSFIVHGHDSQSVAELSLYLQNTLGFGEPLVLRNLPNLGRTIIEKFEEASYQADLVFVLLTPDDAMCSGHEDNEMKRRARQNVIFEMGYFFARMQRKRGRVLLLHKGDIEVPSDIAGIIYIDITAGTVSAGEHIRRELESFL